LPRTARQNFCALGTLWPDTEEVLGVSSGTVIAWGRDLLVEGIRSAAPEAFSEGSTVLPEDLVEGLARSEQFLEYGRLAHRLSRYYQENAGGEEAFGEWLHFASWMQEEPFRDREGEDFGALPDETADLMNVEGRLRLHCSFRRRTWSSALLREVLGVELQEEKSEVMAVHHAGEKRLLLIDATIEQILQGLSQEAPVETWLQAEGFEALELLLENAFVFWFPKPRR